MYRPTLYGLAHLQVAALGLPSSWAAAVLAELAAPPAGLGLETAGGLATFVEGASGSGCWKGWETGRVVPGGEVMYAEAVLPPDHRPSLRAASAMTKFHCWRGKGYSPSAAGWGRMSRCWSKVRLRSSAPALAFVDYDQRPPMVRLILRWAQIVTG